MTGRVAAAPTTTLPLRGSRGSRADRRRPMRRGSNNASYTLGVFPGFLPEARRNDADGCCRGNGMGDGAVSAPLDPPTTTFGDDRSRAGPQLVIPAHAGIQKVDPGLKPAGVTGSGCLRGNDGRVHRPATAARQAWRAGTRGSGIRHPPRRRASGISSPSWKKARKSGVNGP